MAESLKDQKEQFEAGIKALLKTPPLPMWDMPRKRMPTAPKPKRAAKKRG